MAQPTHGVLFNVNPKTGATPAQKALADRIMHGDTRARVPDIVGHLNQGVRHDAPMVSKSFGGPKVGTGKVSGIVAREATARAGVDTHHADVPAHGGGHGGGNPNHDEHGRFT